jgi:hypothetical protein
LETKLTPKNKADRLIERFPVTDLALAVTYKGHRRQRFIQQFVEQFTTRSWRAVRQNANLIYNAQPPIGMELPAPKWTDIEDKIRRGAGRHNASANVQVANLLRDLIAGRNFRAYLTSEQFIHLAPGWLVKVGLNYYLVEDGVAIFQFFQPRADARVDEQVSRTLMSLVHYAYVFGDFEKARVEMADLSAITPGGERVPRFHELAPMDLMSRDDLNAEIDNVHGLLEKISRGL